MKIIILSCTTVSCFLNTPQGGKNKKKNVERQNFNHGPKQKCKLQLCTHLEEQAERFKSTQDIKLYLAFLCVKDFIHQCRIIETQGWKGLTRSPSPTVLRSPKLPTKLLNHISTKSHIDHTLNIFRSSFYATKT